MLAQDKKRFSHDKPHAAKPKQSYHVQCILANRVGDSESVETEALRVPQQRIDWEHIVPNIADPGEAAALVLNGFTPPTDHIDHIDCIYHINRSNRLSTPHTVSTVDIMCWIWVHEIQIQAKHHVLDPADRTTSTTEHNLGQTDLP